MKKRVLSIVAILLMLNLGLAFATNNDVKTISVSVSFENSHAIEGESASNLRLDFSGSSKQFNYIHELPISLEEQAVKVDFPLELTASVFPDGNIDIPLPLGLEENFAKELKRLIKGDISLIEHKEQEVSSIFSFNLSPYSFKLAESRENFADSNYGFGLSLGYDLQLKQVMNLGVKISFYDYLFMEKSLHYLDAFALAKIGYSFCLGNTVVLSPSLLGGLNISHIDNRTAFLGAIGTSLDLSFKINNSFEILLGTEGIYVPQNEAHSLIANTYLGLKWIVGGRR